MNMDISLLSHGYFRVFCSAYVFFDEFFYFKEILFLV